MRLPITSYPSVEQLGHMVDPYSQFVQSIPSMVAELRKQRQVQDDAYGNGTWYSYRNFPVLAAGFAWDMEDQESAVLITGNLKRQPKQKVCAEKRLLGQMRDSKKPFSHLVGIVIAATTDPSLIEAVIDKPRATLPPCFDCHLDFENSIFPVVSNSMPIVTVGLSTDSFQVCTPGSLKDYYSDKSLPTFFHAVQTSMSEWEDRVETYHTLMVQETRAGDYHVDPAEAVLAALTAVTPRSKK
ncbi:MAG: hypothetical protein WBO35_01950 [Candidatus Saccharimonadales bacterium]